MGENAVDTLQKLGFVHFLSTGFMIGTVSVQSEFFEVQKDQMDTLREWMKNTSVTGPSAEELRNNLGWITNHDRFFVEIAETDGELCYHYSFYVFKDNEQALYSICEDERLYVPFELCRRINAKAILSPMFVDNLIVAIKLLWGMFAALYEI